MKKKIFKVVAICILLMVFFLGVGIGITALWTDYYDTTVCWENVQTHETGCGDWVTAERAEFLMKGAIKVCEEDNIPIVFHFKQR